MKLKEKWDKQNNSIKLLLKKLKRHDTRVVAVSVVIAIILCGGLIYLSTPVVTANAQEKIEESEREDKEETAQKLEELHDYLSKIDKIIYNNNKDIRSYYERNTKDSDKEDEYKNVVNEKAGALSGNLGKIHDNINDTNARIDRVKEMIESGNKADKEKIASEFAQVNEELNKLTSDYNDTKNKTMDLMSEIEKAVKNGTDSVSKEQTDQYKELLDKLAAFNKDMDERSKDMLSNSELNFNELYSGLSEKLAKLEEDMDRANKEGNDKNDSRFSELFSKLSDYDEEMDKRNKDVIAAGDKNYTDINNNLNQQFNDYGTKVTTDINGVKEYIDSRANAVNERLDQVFGRVSNGKKLLASALLTKGVKINEDATFAEISRAIEKIPVQMVLNSGETAAEIVYDYHYHTNGKGSKVNANMVSAADRGGCYNTPIYHRHTDSCYSTVNVYVISTKLSVSDRGWVKDDPDGTANNRYRCNHCGKEFVANSARHQETVYSMDEVRSRQGRVEDIIQERVLTCQKNDGQIEGYAPSCGFVYGQVAAAHLKFHGKNAKYNTTVAAINTSNAMVTPKLNTRMSKSMVNLIGMDFGLSDVEESEHDKSEEPIETTDIKDVDAGQKENENNNHVDQTGNSIDGNTGKNCAAENNKGEGKFEVDIESNDLPSNSNEVPLATGATDDTVASSKKNTEPLEEPIVEADDTASEAESHDNNEAQAETENEREPEKDSESGN